MSHERTEFTLLQAALDLTSSLDLKSGLQNFVDQACALTSSPHATMCVLDTWRHHPAPGAPRLLPCPARARVTADCHPRQHTAPRQLPAGRARH